MIPNFDDAKIRILSQIPIHYEKNYKYLDSIKIENKLPTSTITLLPDRPETFLINSHHRLAVYSQPNYKSYFQINLPSSPIIAYYRLLSLITVTISHNITVHQPSHHRLSQHITAHHTLPPLRLHPSKTKKGEPRRQVSGALPCVKGGGHLLSRIALQYHRRRRA